MTTNSIPNNSAYKESVYAEFQHAVKLYADNAFVHIPAGALKHASDVDYTYHEVAAQVNVLLEDYQTLGLKVADRVAILLENRANFFFHWFALNALGVCVVPINGELQVDEIRYLLQDSDAIMAVTVADKKSLLDSAISQLVSPIDVVVHDQLSEFTLARSGPRTSKEPSAQSIGVETECAILYTSGSTGKPKGCILSNEYFLLSGAWYRDATGYVQLEKGQERLITPLPLVHMNAMACSSMGMLMTGGCIIQLDRFHPRSWWQSVRDSGATVIHYLGVMPAILLNMDSDADAHGGDDFSQQVKFGFGAGVNPKHHAVFEQRFGFPLIESWGMTETGCANCITALTEPRHVGQSCIGKKPEHLEVQLVDTDGREVAIGEPGELLLRAKGDNPRRGFFSGYYKNQLATEQAWQNGWLHTGDILRQDSDGAYFFVDRIKNVIRRSGENISALEVEATLSLDPNIAQVAVTAVPDEIRGDEVMACVIAKDNSVKDSAAAYAIMQQAAQSLVYYKLPGYIAFMDELPLTASNKPQRAELKKMARHIVADIEQHSNCYDLRTLKKKK